MKYLQYTEFRNNSKSYIDKVEEGEEYIVIRKGKPVAKIVPFETENQQGWKRSIKKVKVTQGELVSTKIREYRDSE
jgi:prevent-host-death family protein